jgi:aminopeptidase N
MRKQLLLLLSLLITSICVLGQTPTKRFIGCHHKHHQHAKPRSLNMEERVLLNESIARSDTFDILSYIIHIDVTDYTNSYIKAGTTISIVPKMEDQISVRLDLMSLQVDSVKQEEDHLNFQYDASILTVFFQNTPSLTDTVSFTVYYQGTPQRDPEWGGFYFENQYIYNLGIGLSSIPPNFGKVWYPCFDSFVERATYEYHVKSAGTYRAHCQGEFLGEVQLGGDTVIRSFAMNQAIPTHLSAIAVANYQNIDYIHVGAFGDVPVRLTGKQAQINSMSNALQNVGAAIDACEHWYGPHAWERVGYVLTTDGALEIPTNIAYPQYMVTQSVAVNNGLLSHELGHHWWGDVVTPYNHNDMWLKEGPAEYSSHLLEEWLYGDGAFVDMVKTNHLDVLRNAHIDELE